MKARDKPGRPRNTSREQDQAMVEVSCWHNDLCIYEEVDNGGNGGYEDLLIPEV